MVTVDNTYTTEEDVIQGCIKRNAMAQRALYEKYSSKMLSVCMRYTGRRDQAEDVMHDGFITVFEKIGSYNRMGSFEGWLRRIFVNTALMSLRKGDVLKFSDELSSAEREYSADSSALSNISSKELMRLIASMPSGFRIVFNMYAIEGFSHQEIAKELNISEGSSRSQLSRARVWLQNRLENIEEKDYITG